MNEDELARAKMLAEEQWKQLVRIIAPQHQVDAEQLLKKHPRFPVNVADPGQVQACLSEVHVKGEEMTEAEARVCMLAHEAMKEMLLSVIRDKLLGLPDLGDKQ